MKGAIVHYSNQKQIGVIRADNRDEYPFQATHWQENIQPDLNQHVEFQLSETKDITAVYLLPEQEISQHLQQNTFAITPAQLAKEYDYSMVDWFMKCMTTHYLNFSGRARRRELWSFLFIATMVSFFTITTDSIFGISAASYIINAALLTPLLAVGTRRLHDVGLSGWWQLLYISVIGIVLLWAMWLINTEKEANTYGEPAKVAPHDPIYS